MAKGKSNSSKTQSNSFAKRKTSSSSKDDQSTAVKKAADAQPIISNEQIGRAAGQVWHLLNQDGGQSLAAIKKATDAPTELVLAAIGWLAREDKLDFNTTGRTVKISLR